MEGDVNVIDSTWIRNSQVFLETDSNIHYYHHDISKEAISFTSQFHSYDANKEMPIFYSPRTQSKESKLCIQAASKTQLK